MAKKVKLPADLNKRAKSIVDLVTAITIQESPSQDELTLAASLLGKKGGSKGGKARAKKLSPKRRSEIAKKAAAARWGKQP